MEKKPVKIFLFSDALGYEIVRKYDFLNDLFPFRYPLATQFGYSSTAVPTILSGKSPKEHGHFSFFFYDRQQKGPFRFFRYLHPFLHPDKVFAHPRVRHKISAVLKKVLGFSGYFNLYSVPFDRLVLMDYCEKHDIFAANGLAPCKNLKDLLVEKKIPHFISNWRLSDEENMQAAEQAVTSGKYEFIFIYTAGIDGFLHFNIGNDAAVKERLESFADSVKKLVRLAEDHPFHLFSDHGMTPLRGAVDLKVLIERLPYRFGQDYVACYDSTMLRIWFLQEHCRKELMQTLNSAPGTWLTAEQKQAWGIDFADNRYGDEIFLLAPGFQIVPSDMGNKAIPGMHGFDPYDKDSVACLLCRHPLAHPPASLADMAHFMLETES